MCGKAWSMLPSKLENSIEKNSVNSFAVGVMRMTSSLDMRFKSRTISYCALTLLWCLQSIHVESRWIVYTCRFGFSFVVLCVSLAWRTNRLCKETMKAPVCQWLQLFLTLLCSKNYSVLKRLLVCAPTITTTGRWPL